MSLDLFNKHHCRAWPTYPCPECETNMAARALPCPGCSRLGQFEVADGVLRCSACGWVGPSVDSVVRAIRYGQRPFPAMEREANNEGQRHE